MPRESSNSVMCAFHLNIADLSDAIDCRNKSLPPPPLLGKHLPSIARELVIAPTTLSLFLHPLADDPAAPFQAVEERVEGGHFEAHFAIGPLLDDLADLV